MTYEEAAKKYKDDYAKMLNAQRKAQARYKIKNGHSSDNLVALMEFGYNHQEWTVIINQDIRDVEATGGVAKNGQTFSPAKQEDPATRTVTLEEVGIDSSKYKTDTNGNIIGIGIPAANIIKADDSIAVKRAKLKWQANRARELSINNEFTSESELDKKMSDTYRRLLKKAKLEVANKSKAFLEETVDSGNTPTKRDTISSIRSEVYSSLLKDHDYQSLNNTELDNFKNSLDTFISAKVGADYDQSLILDPREVNGEMPFQLSKNQKANIQSILDDVNKAVAADLNNMLSSCAKKGTCPSEEQITQYLNDAISRAIEKYGSGLSNDELKYLRNKSKKNLSNYLRTYHAYADNVKVTNTFPGSSTAPSGASIDKAPEPEKQKKDAAIRTVSEWARTNVSFSGCDMAVSASMRTTNGTLVSVTIGSLQTVSYSIYRKLSPIYNIGNINAKDYVGGPRTIAGSLVFTVFNHHWGTDLIDQFSKAEGYASSQKVLMDEIAPIDLTITMANEYGITSRLAIYSIRLFSEGQVMSINDIYTENTYQYVALNIDYLADINATVPIEQPDDDTSSTGSSANGRQTSGKSDIKPAEDGGQKESEDQNGSSLTTDNKTDANGHVVYKADSGSNQGNSGEKSYIEKLAEKDTFDYSQYKSRRDCDIKVSEYYQREKSKLIDKLNNKEISMDDYRKEYRRIDGEYQTRKALIAWHYQNA